MSFDAKLILAALDKHFDAVEARWDRFFAAQDQRWAKQVASGVVPGEHHFQAPIVTDDIHNATDESRTGSGLTSTELPVAADAGREAPLTARVTSSAACVAEVVGSARPLSASRLQQGDAAEREVLISPRATASSAASIDIKHVVSPYSSPSAPSTRGIAEDDTASTTPTRCSSDCLSHDVTVLKPICVVPISTLNNLPTRCSVQVHNSNTMLSTLPISYLFPLENNKGNSNEYIPSRYIPINSFATSSGVILLSCATEVYEDSKVLVWRSSQCLVTPCLLYATVVDVEPWPPPLKHMNTLLNDTIKLYFSLELSFDRGQEVVKQRPPWPPPIPLDMQRTNVQFRPAPWPSFWEYSFIVDTSVHLPTRGEPVSASTPALLPDCINCYWLQWEIAWPLTLMVCWFGDGMPVTVNLQIALQRYISGAKLAIFCASHKVLSSKRFMLPPQPTLLHNKIMILWLSLKYIIDLGQGHSMLLPCVNITLVCGSSNAFAAETIITSAHILSQYYSSSVEFVLQWPFLFCFHWSSRVDSVYLWGGQHKQSGEVMKRGSVQLVVCILWEFWHPFLADGHMARAALYKHIIKLEIGGFSPDDILLNSDSYMVIPLHIFNNSSHMVSAALIQCHAWDVKLHLHWKYTVLLECCDFEAVTISDQSMIVVPLQFSVRLLGCELIQPHVDAEWCYMPYVILLWYSVSFLWIKVEVHEGFYPCLVAEFMFRVKVLLLAASFLVIKLVTSIKHLQAPWDPGGMDIRHRLGGKPILKKGGMLGYLCSSGPVCRDGPKSHVPVGPACLLSIWVEPIRWLLIPVGLGGIGLSIIN